MDIIQLTCPNCGGKLQVTQDLERFACAYCGSEHHVKRSGGVASLAPAMDSLAKIKARVEKTESELALQRLREETAEIKAKLDDVNYANQAFGGIVLMVAGLITIVWNILTNYNMVLLGLLCILIGMGLFSNGMKTTNEEQKLEKALKQKTAEIAHHEKVLRQ